MSTSDSDSVTSSPGTQRKQIDIDMIQKQNMDRLQIYAYSQTRSAPNSPMMQRVLRNSQKPLEQKEVKLEDYFPNTKIVNRPKNLTQQQPGSWRIHMNEGENNLSKSWNEKHFLSPQNSPRLPRRDPDDKGTISPRSVSSRSNSPHGGSPKSKGIASHYLMNVSDRPGSFMLKKSEAILHSKSPQLPRKLPPIQLETGWYSNGIQIKKETVLLLDNTKIVISSPKDYAQIGFNIEDTSQNENNNIMNKEDQASLSHTIQIVADDEVKPEKSMFSPIKKTGPMVIPAGEHSLMGKDAIQQVNNDHKPTPIRKQLVKLSQPVAVNVQKAKEVDSKGTGLLTPPLLHKGSREFALEMEKRHLEYQMQKNLAATNTMPSTFEEAEGTPPTQRRAPPQVHKDDDDDDEGLSFEVQSINKLTDIHRIPVILPPVHVGSPNPIQMRDFEHGAVIQQEVSEEEWEQLHHCRYLRNPEVCDEEVNKEGEEEHNDS